MGLVIGKAGACDFSAPGPELVARDIEEEPGWPTLKKFEGGLGDGLLADLDSVCTGQGHACGQPHPSALTGTHRGTSESTGTC